MRALLLLALITACTDPVPPRPPGVMVISQEQQAAWIRNFNPFLPPGLARFPSRGGVHEPLLIWNTLTGEYVPWLATAWSWQPDARAVTLEVRDGVRWSDGARFGAEDVVFTFELLRRHPALDLEGVWTFLERVERDGERVTFHFTRPYAPGLYYVGQTPIVPAHVWREIDDPVRFANPRPVATGPFTEVEIFEDQLYQLGRNPYYWRGEPAIASLRFPAFASNEQANLALIHGEVDWAGNFVPAIDRIYDGEHWFPRIDSTIVLYPNTTRAPLDDPRVRKALSLAIDRELLVEVAMYGYTVPADPSGLDDSYAAWRMPAAEDWLRHDPDEARRLLEQAGCGRLSLEIQTVSGWSDWVRAAQVIARDLEAVGVDATVRTFDFTAWFDRLQRGDYDLSIGWTESGPTPYAFYRALMSSEMLRPVGVAAARNWNRFTDAEADAALASFERALDPPEQRRVAAALQARFVASAPVIPLFPSPSWAEYRTERFVGFPSEADPYARPSPNRQPETLLVLTKVRPREPER